MAPRLGIGAATATAAAVLVLAGCGGGASTSPAPSSVPDQSTAPTDPAPLPNQGTGAVAPGVPTAKGGDNSIQTYGLEADSRERVEVAATVGAYLAAQAAGRWGAACSQLTAMVRANLAALARRMPGGAEDCAGEMAALLAKVPAGALRDASRIHVLSFRMGGDQGFLIYRDGTGRPFNLPLTRQGGSWRIGSVAGIGLTL